MLFAGTAWAWIVAADLRAGAPDRALRHMMVVPVAMAMVVMVVPATASIGVIMVAGMRVSWRVGVIVGRCERGLGIGHGAPLFPRF
jgi:hypothetical protein